MDQAALASSPEHTKAGLLAIHGDSTQEERTESHREIAKRALELMREGTLIADIAEQLNLSKGRISQLVIEHYPEDWKIAKTAANLIRYDSAQKEFDKDGTKDEEKQDLVKLAYARERAKYAHLMLQVTNREVFGDKQTITLNQGITMDQALDGMAQALLSKMRVVPNDAEQQSQCSIEQEAE